MDRVDFLQRKHALTCGYDSYSRIRSRLGQSDKNPSTPFLRESRDGRPYAIWTKDDAAPQTLTRQVAARAHHTMAPSPLRAALLAWSADGGTTWSAAKRVNSVVEAVRGEENGPKAAFGGTGWLQGAAFREGKTITQVPMGDAWLAYEREKAFWIWLAEQESSNR